VNSSAFLRTPQRDLSFPRINFKTSNNPARGQEKNGLAEKKFAVGVHGHRGGVWQIFTGTSKQLAVIRYP